MIKIIQIALIIIMIASVNVLAGSISEEHEKAKAGGYEKQYEKTMKDTQGSKTEKEHNKYHEGQVDKNKNEQGKNSKDKENLYGKEWLDQQLK